MALAALPQARRPTAKVLTVDLFSGVVQLDAKGEAKVSLKMPDFNGTVRVTALAFGEDRYGGADTETIVRAPLVAEISTPRVMAPGDAAQLTLDLQNFSGSEREFDVKVTADKPLAVAQGARKVKLADNAKTTLNFPLTATDGFGVGKINVLAQSGDIKIKRDFELAVRPAWPAVLRSSPRALDKLDPITIGADAIKRSPRRFGQRAAHGVEPAAAAVCDRAQGSAQVSVRVRRADNEQGFRRADPRREDRRESARRRPHACAAQGARRRRDRSYRVDADSIGPLLDVGRRQLRQRDPDAVRGRVPARRARRRLQRSRRNAAEGAEAAQRRPARGRPSVLWLRASGRVALRRRSVLGLRARAREPRAARHVARALRQRPAARR